VIHVNPKMICESLLNCIGTATPPIIISCQLMLASNSRIWPCPFKHYMPRAKAFSPALASSDSTVRLSCYLPFEADITLCCSILNTVLFLFHSIYNINLTVVTTPLLSLIYNIMINPMRLEQRWPDGYLQCQWKHP